MYASVRCTKGESSENFQRQGSLRRVLPPEHNKEYVLEPQNAELNKMYKIYRQEYVILAEYKMIQSENIQGVYVIPSKQNSFLWFGVIFVRNGPYEDGIFRFNMILDEHFPDSEHHPKVVFQSEMFHPVIDSTNYEINLLGAFPIWNKNKQHLWQVLKYVQWIFGNIEGSLTHAVNRDAVEMYKTNQNEFRAKAQELVKLSISKDCLYEEPPTEDKHYIIFEEYIPEVHDKYRGLMNTFQEEPAHNKIGHSWVLSGNYKPLARPPSPLSENES